MKQMIMEFLRRGFMACGLGPLVLAVCYLTLKHQGAADLLTVEQVCTGILSLSALAFMAGGMNVVYGIERLPLMAAILIHGGVLYLGYIATYLLNGWLERGFAPMVIFTLFFVLGYLAIWAVIYAAIKRRTRRINEMLLKKQQRENR